MSSDYKEVVNINAPIETIFESSKKYFTSIGYTEKNEIAPSRIEFLKKGTVWTTDDIDFTHKLTVFLNPEGDSVRSTFHFIVESGLSAGGFSSKSKRVANSEIGALLGLIYSSNPHKTNKNEKDRICIECKKNMPWDAKFCPHCGYEYK